jgi:hypothetical protein
MSVVERSLAAAIARKHLHLIPTDSVANPRRIRVVADVVPVHMLACAGGTGVTCTFQTGETMPLSTLPIGVTGM